MLGNPPTGPVVPRHPRVHWEEVIVTVKVRLRNAKEVWCVVPTTVETIMKMPTLQLIAVHLQVSLLLVLLGLDKKCLNLIRQKLELGTWELSTC